MQNRRASKKASRRVVALPIYNYGGDETLLRATIGCSFLLFLRPSRTILCQEHFSASYEPFANSPRYLRMCVLMTRPVIRVPAVCSREFRAESLCALRGQKYFLSGRLVISRTLFLFKIIWESWENGANNDKRVSFRKFVTT